MYLCLGNWQWASNGHLFLSFSMDISVLSLVLANVFIHNHRRGVIEAQIKKLEIRIRFEIKFFLFRYLKFDPKIV